jgi:hypothetical protein
MPTRHDASLSYKRGALSATEWIQRSVDSVHSLLPPLNPLEQHMNPVTPSTPDTSLPDKDLADQALPGHGIPSQDPSAAAQHPLDPDEAAREAGSVLAAGGVMVGAAAGAGIGVAVAGPVGVVVGGAIGGVAGALGGAAAGRDRTPE